MEQLTARDCEQFADLGPKGGLGNLRADEGQKQWSQLHQSIETEEAAAGTDTKRCFSQREQPRRPRRPRRRSLDLRDIELSPGRETKITFPEGVEDYVSDQQVQIKDIKDKDGVTYSFLNQKKK